MARVLNILQKDERPRRHINYSLIFWLAILAAYATAGLRGLKISEQTPKVSHIDAYASSDAILKQTASMPDGSRELLEAFAQLPPLRPVTIICPPSQAHAIITCQIAGYLAWPREVWPLEVSAKNFDRAVLEFNDPAFAAILFYLAKPRIPLPGEKKLGPVIDIVPIGEPNRLHP